MPKKQKRPAQFNFKPFSKQQKRLIHWWRPGIKASENNYVIADGSIRSGKTIACIIGFLTWSQEMFSGETFILVGKTMGALKKNVIKPMLQILESWGWPYEYVRSGSEPHLTIGSNTYYLFGANNEAAQDNLQGLTAAGAYADEAALFPKSFIDQMIGRCSVDGWKIWMNCNPAGPHHFICEEYLDPDEMKRKKVYHLHFTMDDNLSLSKKRKQEYENAWPHDSVFYKRFILGLWVVADGLVYQMFSEKDHVVKTPMMFQQLHEYYVSIDYGTVNPFAVGIFDYDPRTSVSVMVKEVHHDGRKSGRCDNEKYYELMVNAIADLPIEYIIVDPSAAGFIETIKKYGKYSVKGANNDVLNGIQEVTKYLNMGLLKIHDSCTETKKEFYTYSWDDGKKGDAVIKEYDHHMDLIRYYVYTVARQRNRWVI